MVVVACNTASAAAIDDLRQAFPVPFVGMVPGLKPAALQSPARHVAILATPGTLDGALYARVAGEFGRGTRVEDVSGDGLADAVERGEASAPATVERVREILGPAIAAGADTVVLGCTHYHFLTPAITAAFPGAGIVDTTEAVARRAVADLHEAGLTAPAGSQGGIDLIVSGDREAFRAVMAALDIAPAGVA
jgi:glutamate racemase